VRDALDTLLHGHAFGQGHGISIRPSGFQTPFLHVPPQAQSVGVGAGGAGGVESRRSVAAARFTAAAARGRSCSSAAGSADSQTNSDTIHRQSDASMVTS